MLACLALLVLVAVLVPWDLVLQAKRSGPSPALSHLKQLTIALEVYAADWDDKHPPRMSSARGAWRHLKTLVKPKVLETRNGPSTEWLGNGSLAAKPRRAVPQPSRTLAFFDSAPRRGYQGRLVSFVDGHVRFLKENLFQQAVRDGMRTGGVE